MKTICILSTKGGVGKTTIATCLAAKAANKVADINKKVCIIDFDTYGPTHWYLYDYDWQIRNKTNLNGNTSSSLPLGRDLGGLLVKATVPDNIIHDFIEDHLYTVKIKNFTSSPSFSSLPLFPSTVSLTNINSQLNSENGVEHIGLRLGALIHYLKEEMNYEYVIIDFSPGLYIGSSLLLDELSGIDETVLCFISAANDPDMTETIYEIDWFFSEAYKRDVSSLWILNKSKESDASKELDECKRRIWEGVVQNKSLDYLHALSRLLMVFPQDIEHLIRGKLSISDSELNIFSIPWDKYIGEFGNGSKDTMVNKLWSYLIDDKLDFRVHKSKKELSKEKKKRLQRSHEKLHEHLNTIYENLL